ncbi:MAG: IclR family transcriptional regulator [Thermodesulfobacteriota bacterium]
MKLRKNNRDQGPKEADRQVDTVARAIEILNCFTVERPELSLKELSEMTGLYKSRILRLCGTLVAHRYLTRLPGASGYGLGSRLLVLGKIYERTNTLASLARPILRDLARNTGESASLFVIEGLKRLCLAREEGPSAIRYSILEGQTLELYAGAGGKVLLAYSPKEMVDQVLSRIDLKKLTDATITDRDRLEKTFATIRRQGYGESLGERLAEAAALAAPVFDHTGKVHAVLTLAGPIQRFSAKRRRAMTDELKAAAHKLSVQLGYQTD